MMPPSRSVPLNYNTIIDMIMKRKTILFVLLLCLLFNGSPANAQIIEIVKAATKKVIRAIDLKIQKQQNKVIWLQNAQKTLENTMSKLKLKEISDWSEKQRKLYDDYFQELQKVKNIIATYKKIKDIIVRQSQLISEYKQAWSLLKADKHFTSRELEEMYRIYSGIMDESLKNIDQLIMVSNSFTTQMTDGKRMELIEAASNSVDRNLTDLRIFNRRNFSISVSRSANIQEAETMKKIYGLN